MSSNKIKDVIPKLISGVSKVVEKTLMEDLGHESPSVSASRLLVNRGTGKHRDLFAPNVICTYTCVELEVRRHLLSLVEAEISTIRWQVQA